MKKLLFGVIPDVLHLSVLHEALTLSCHSPSSVVSIDYFPTASSHSSLKLS